MIRLHSNQMRIFDWFSLQFFYWVGSVLNTPNLTYDMMDQTWFRLLNELVLAI